MKQIDQFLYYLQSAAISKDDKKAIETVLPVSFGKINAQYLFNRYLFWGDPGVGKSFIANKLFQIIPFEKVYMGQEQIKADKCFQDFLELGPYIENDKPQVIFIDDLGMHVEPEVEYLNPEDAMMIQKIMDIVRKNNKILIVTSNEFAALTDRIIDRFDCRIEFGLPDIVSKKRFLRANYYHSMTKGMIDYIAENSIRCNFRDLPNIVTKAKAIGQYHISMDSVREAVRKYMPNSLYWFSMENDHKYTLSDVRKKEPMKVIRRVVSAYRRGQSNLRRHNLLLFHGPNGTGKTFMAKAIAGELQYPLLTLNLRNLNIGALHDAFKILRNYRKCIVFIDEADKLIGNRRFDSDDPLMGDILGQMDGVNSQRIRGLLIFSANDLSKFSSGLLDRMVDVKFELPSYNERLMYCQDRMKNVRARFSEDFYARMTKKMTYRQMDKLWDNLMFDYEDQKRPLTDNNLRDLLCNKKQDMRMFG